MSPPFSYTHEHPLHPIILRQFCVVYNLLVGSSFPGIGSASSCSWPSGILCFEERDPRR